MAELLVPAAVVLALMCERMASDVAVDLQPPRTTVCSATVSTITAILIVILAMAVIVLLPVLATTRYVRLN